MGAYLGYPKTTKKHIPLIAVDGLREIGKTKKKITEWFRFIAVCQFELLFQCFSHIFDRVFFYFLVMFERQHITVW